MAIFSLVGLLLIATLLMSMLAQARPWIKLKAPGKVIKTQNMNFFQRVLFHRSSLIALALGIVLEYSIGLLPAPLAGFAGIFALLIVLFPMKYTFTTQGVAVGQAIFRPWKEFTQIKMKTNQIILEHPSFFGRLTLFVKPVDLESVFAVIGKSRQ